MQQKLEPLTFFLICFAITAMAGVAAFLRSGKEVTVRGVISVILNTGIMGLGIALLLFNYFQDNAYFLVGLCILAGLGGMTLVGFFLAIFKQGGLQITLKPGSEEEQDDRES